MGRKYENRSIQTKLRQELLNHITSHPAEAICRLCWKPIDLTLKHPDKNAFEADHIIPRAQGGQDVIENLQPAHAFCNNSKGKGVIGNKPNMPELTVSQSWLVEDEKK